MDIVTAATGNQHTHLTNDRKVLHLVVSQISPITKNLGIIFDPPWAGVRMSFQTPSLRWVLEGHGLLFIFLLDFL